MSERLCVFCRHWRFDGGEPGYSEDTPGIDASMDCSKGHYRSDYTLQDLRNESEFRDVIRKAEICKDYDQVEPSPANHDRWPEESN